MSILKIQSAILQRPWLIQPEFAYSKLGIIEKILAGEPVSFEKDDDEDPDERMSKVSYSVSPEGAVTFGSWRDPFEGALPGSTAVIAITGPIMKYDNCGDYGTKSYAALIAKANRNSNISSVLIIHDSPGGTVDGTMELASFIKQNPKPVVSLVDGMMASADYWIGSSAREVVANNETSEIGSIGTMITFFDYTEYYKQKGISVKHIYADASIHKNETYHETLKGNEKPIKDELNKLNNMFISAVRSNRPNIQETALTGKMFLAEDALQQGLIDSIGGFDAALLRAQTIAGITGKKSVHVIKPNMKKITLLASHAAFLALCGATIEAGNTSVEVDANDELTGKINSALEAGTKAAADLTAAQNRIAELEAAAATAATELTAARAATEKVTGEFAAFKEGNGGATNPPSKKTGESLDSDVESEVWSLPHNKAALEDPLFS